VLADSSEGFMNITYTDSAKQTGEGTALLQQVTNQLEEILGPAAARVKAEWDRQTDAKGRLLFILSLTDWTGSVRADFAPDELRSADHLRYRLHRLWGDLLQVRSQKQLEQLTGAGGATEG
jgi:hypothetical protein